MRSHKLILWFAVGWLGLILPRTAHAVPVEKVVAVVGEKAILLTDLRKRARPFLFQMYQKLPDGPQRAAAESKMYSQLLDRMVDEELESVAALRTNTTVSSEDLDKALQNMARMARMTMSQFLKDVQASSGMTEQEYRQEIRRQVLEGKLLQRLVQNRFRITEQDLQRMFDTVRRLERNERQYNPAWIVLRFRADNEAERRALAAELTKRARAGEDFAALAQQHSDDAGTREKGGNLGIRAPGASQPAQAGKRAILAPPLEKVVLKMQPGEVSAPTRFQDALVIFKLLSRQPSRYASPDTVRPELIQRVKAEQLEQAKAKWLKDLRRRTHVDIRL